jgi:hypothetical protein
LEVKMISNLYAQTIPQRSMDHAIADPSGGNSKAGVSFLNDMFQTYPFITALVMLFILGVGLWLLMKLPHLLKKEDRNHNDE